MVVVEEGGVKENKFYVFIALFLVIVIISAVIFSTREIKPARVPDSFLDNGWVENLDERETASDLFGLEKWCSLTYKIGGAYPANLTVATFKPLIMMDEKGLLAKAEETIHGASQQGIVVDNSTKANGSRILVNGHKTYYITFDGSDTSKTPYEKIKVVAEVWNCGTSGTSVICIGVAQITDYAHNVTGFNTSSWRKIVNDKNGLLDFVGNDGLIYNIVCH
jgi:hypothetical protein